MENTENKEKILKGAEELFLKFGIRSVSMDDIARHLGISKKTIYQHFKDKDDIVNQVAQGHFALERSMYDEVLNQSSNAIEEAMGCMHCMKEQLEDLNPSLMFDMQKYHPEAWKIWMDFKVNFVRNSIISNIVRGIEEGYFRPEINAEILATYRLEQVQMTLEQDFLPKGKYNLSQVQTELFEHFMYGLLTEKGRQVYQKYKDQFYQTIISES